MDFYQYELPFPPSDDDALAVPDVGDALLMALDDLDGGPDGPWWVTLGTRDWDEAPASIYQRRWLAMSAIERARKIVATGMRSLAPLPEGYDTAQGAPRTFADIARVLAATLPPGSVSEGRQRDR